MTPFRVAGGGWRASDTDARETGGWMIGGGGKLAWGQGADTKTRGQEGRRELAPGFRRLKAERLNPERLTTVAVTRHLE